MFEAAPVAPPADGLKATAAGPASGDGFPEFWSAWPRKHGKKAAEAEWKKITHDVDIIIDAARIWADHYAKHGTDKKWIPEPANWLKGERWDEDLPLIHGDAKGAAIAKAKANAPAKTVEAETPRRTGVRTVDVFKSSVDRSDGKTLLTLYFVERDQPTTWEHTIILEHPDMKTQQDGQKEFAELCKAMDVWGVDDSTELHRPVRIMRRPQGRLEYLPVPSNDNEKEAA